MLLGTQKVYFCLFNRTTIIIINANRKFNKQSYPINWTPVTEKTHYLDTLVFEYQNRAFE